MNSENLNGENSVDSVHSVEKPLPNGAAGASDIEGKAETGSGERGGSRTSFNSKKVYVSGKIHPDVRVPSFVIPSGGIATREERRSLTISVRI